MDSLTIPEYELLMKAVRLKEVDKDYRNHLQAFLNFKVQAKRKVGKNKEKPVYSTFKKFFDYEKTINDIASKKKESKFAGIGALLGKGKSHGGEL
ncbi:MAG: hypothetical protein PHW34_13325 [Hespellia sp.]|nr:hypothetical protein [Hespellia sp.]